MLQDAQLATALKSWAVCMPITLSNAHYWTLYNRRRMPAYVPVFEESMAYESECVIRDGIRSVLGRLVCFIHRSTHILLSRARLFPGLIWGAGSKNAFSFAVP